MEMPKRIILVRHGETDHNVRKIVQGQLDVPLNKQGIAQAKTAGIRLKKLKIDYAYSSDLKRAHTTAIEITKHHTIQLVTTPLLRERYYGQFQGKSHEEIVVSIPETKSVDWRELQVSGKKYGIETNDEVIARLTQFKNKLHHDHPDKTVLIVAHGGSIHLLFTLYGLSVKQAYDIPISNAGIFTLTKQTETYILSPF